MSSPPLDRYVTPLRYPGGKSKLTNFVKALLRANRLLDGEYVEAYAGGASIALSLLLDDYVSRVHINDLDPAIYAFWDSVLNNTDELCKLIIDTKVSTTQWRKQRRVQSLPNDHDTLKLGFSTFFLNRTNRSGIICSGGMIGGKNQTGKWKLDARYNKQELVRRIRRIADYRYRISLYHLDAVRLLTRLLPKLPEKTLIYLDPPYYVKGKRRLYTNFYEHDDHVQIAETIGAAKRRWLVSYDDTHQVRALYYGRRFIPYGLNYTARDRYQGAEIIFFSDDLVVPESGSSLLARQTRPSTITRIESMRGRP